VLFQFVDDASTRLQWLVLDKSDQADNLLTTGDFEQFRQSTAGSELIYVMSGNEVLLREAELPNKRLLNPASILPYLLEDELAEDVEHLHIAHARIPASGKMAVAVVNQDKLAELLDRLAQQGVMPNYVIAAPLLLPWQHDHWSVLVLEDQVCVRTAELRGFCVSKALFDVVLQKLFTDGGEQPAAKVTVWQQAHEQVASAIAMQGLEVDKREQPASGLFGIAELSQAVLQLNLIKQRRNNGGSFKQTAKALLPAAAVLLLAFLVLFGDLGYRYQLLQEQRDGLNQASVALFEQAFPQVQRIVDPVVQAQQLLDKRRAMQQVQKDDFLYLLHQLGQELQANPGMRLAKLQYRNGQLSLWLNAEDIADVERLQKQLMASGKLKTDVVSTVAVEQGVDARMQLRRKI
jgi:general secretion pathway protein L